jgi:Flp pilus assembly protein TadD
VQGQEEALGAKHPSTLIYVNNLAQLLQARGKLDEAEPLFLRALQGKEEALGAKHPHTLTSVNNLAFLLKARGKLDEAEPLFQHYRAAKQ